jgi:hypothetical protein
MEGADGGVGGVRYNEISRKPARKKGAEMGSEDNGRSEMSVWQ